MIKRQGLCNIDTDANPFCEPLTAMERVLLIGTGLASIVVVMGIAGYLYVRFISRFFTL